MWWARACAILHKSWRHVRLKLPSPRKRLHLKFPNVQTIGTINATRTIANDPDNWDDLDLLLFDPETSLTTRVFFLRGARDDYMKTTYRPSCPDRLQFFWKDWGDRDDPDDHMEIRLYNSIPGSKIASDNTLRSIDRGKLLKFPNLL